MQYVAKWIRYKNFTEKKECLKNTNTPKAQNGPHKTTPRTQKSTPKNSQNSHSTMKHPKRNTKLNPKIPKGDSVKNRQICLKETLFDLKEWGDMVCNGKQSTAELCWVKLYCSLLCDDKTPTEIKQSEIQNDQFHTNRL